MGESRRFKVILKKEDDQYITADEYSADRSGRYIFRGNDNEVAAFQIAEVVGIVDVTDDPGPVIA